MSLLPVDIEVYAMSLVEVLDNSGPSELRAAVQWLEEKADDHAVKASQRRLYRALAKILREEAKR